MVRESGGGGGKPLLHYSRAQILVDYFFGLGGKIPSWSDKTSVLITKAILNEHRMQNAHLTASKVCGINARPTLITSTDMVEKLRTPAWSTCKQGQKIVTNKNNKKEKSGCFFSQVNFIVNKALKWPFIAK